MHVERVRDEYAINLVVDVSLLKQYLRILITDLDYDLGQLDMVVNDIWDFLVELRVPPNAFWANLHRNRPPLYDISLLLAPILMEAQLTPADIQVVG